MADTKNLLDLYNAFDSNRIIQPVDPRKQVDGNYAVNYVDTKNEYQNNFKTNVDRTSADNTLYTQLAIDYADKLPVRADRLIAPIDPNITFNRWNRVVPYSKSNIQSK